MTVPRAIETKYKGYRFRSRLEARWAVFFDTLGLQFEYEKEGYRLPSGHYLPDFYLPSLRSWLEVKPSPPSVKELRLCSELALATGIYALLVWGPINGTLVLSEPTGWVDVIELAKQLTNERGILGFPAYDNEVAGKVRRHAEFAECESNCWPISPTAGDVSKPCPRCGNSPKLDRVMSAYTAAQSARFEFGEDGVPKPTVPPVWDSPLWKS